MKAACIGCHGGELKGGPIPGAPPEWIPASDIGAGSVVSQWSQAQFSSAMREGRRPDGSEIKFPMPIAMTSKMTDDELMAIGAYLRSLK